MTFGSLFAGIGGFDLGLERAGMKCLWQVEIDDYATRVLEKHWPNVPRWRDVRTFAASGIMWHTNPRVDVICGGFPCQDISVAGRGAGIDGARSGLWREFARVIRVVRPRVAIVENSPALLGRGMGRVLSDLAASGYDAEWFCLPAASFGAPHLRWRLFIVAYAYGELAALGRNRPMGGGECQECAAQAAQGVSANSPGVGRETQRRREELRRERQRQAGRGCDHAHARRPLAHSDGRRHGAQEEALFSGRNVPEQSDFWTDDPGIRGVGYGIPNRVDRVRCLGNAVVPQVAEWIGRRIMDLQDRIEAGRQ